MEVRRVPGGDAGDLERQVTRRSVWRWVGAAATFGMVTSADSAAATTTVLDDRVARLVRGDESLTRRAVDRLVRRRIGEFERYELPEVLGAQALSSATPLRRTLDPLYGSSGPQDVTTALLRFRAAMACRDTGLVRVVAVGSSTTAGAGATAANRRYLNRLAVHTQRAHPLASGAAHPATLTLSEAGASGADDLGIQFVNAGVGGTTSRDYVTDSTRQEIARLAPRVVLHMVGSNDYAQSVPASTYLANLRAQVEALGAAISSPCAHLLVHSFERSDVVGTLHPWSEYGDAMRQLALSNPANIAFVDLSDVYSSLGVPGPDPYGMLAADRVHQTDHGHALMADVLHERLSRP